MIEVTRIHGNGSMLINADLIETIEACPDTTITLVTKRKFVVADPVDVVLERVIAFRQQAAWRFTGVEIDQAILGEAA